MPSIIISKDSHLYNVYSLEGQTRIGRGSGNDIPLNDVGVSRRHARIEQTTEGFDLIDEGSTNGTFVDDQRMDRCPLSHGKSFRIHDYLFTFVDDIRSQDAPPAGMTIVSQEDATSWRQATANRPALFMEEKDGLAHKLSQLLKMVTDLYASTGDVDFGTLVLVTLLDITGGQRAILSRRDSTGEMSITHIRGFGPHGTLPEVICDFLKSVMEEGAWIFYHRDAEEQADKRILELDVHSVLCMPLLEKDRTVGCLYLDHPERNNGFLKTDRDLVFAVAGYVAQAFLMEEKKENRLDRDEQRYARELETEGIIARSPKTIKVFQDTKKIASFNVAVLIYGETGTGKEVIARYIHDRSKRTGAFIACNCSAIAAAMFESELFGHEKGAFTGATQQKPGLLELADGGTIFLDEIGDMPFEQQAKLLRALQEQEVWRVGGRRPVKIDLRVISATHKDIKNDREALQFRDDLYFRLANVEITAPPLRDRTEDIGPLSRQILKDLSEQHMNGKRDFAISIKALRLLQAYDWPGNIRELRNTLFQAAYRCDGGTIDRHHLKDLLNVFEVSPDVPAGSIKPLIEVERGHIQMAMQQANWNKSAAAKLLQVDRNRLSRLLKKMEIEEPKT